MISDYRNVLEYWRASSRKDFIVATDLAKLGHYAHALFFCHLALEKLLKALYVARQHEHAPYVHDLVILARKSDIGLSDLQIDSLQTITTFNIQGRYADEKSEFYGKYNKKKCCIEVSCCDKGYSPMARKKFQKK